MDVTEAVEFVATNHRAVLVTRRSNGEPQLSPVAVAPDGRDRVLISTRETAMKTKNLARHPRAWLCVMNDNFFGEWVQLAGPAEVVHLPEAMELLVEYYRRVAGEHPDWDDYRAAMERERRVIVRITVEEAGPTKSG